MSRDVLVAGVGMIPFTKPKSHRDEEGREMGKRNDAESTPDAYRYLGMESVLVKAARDRCTKSATIFNGRCRTWSEIANRAVEPIPHKIEHSIR